MPERKSVQRAQRAAHRGRAPSTQAGEFVREEIHHIRTGKHGARSTKQAIAIGLSKARTAGVKAGRPGAQRKSAGTRTSLPRQNRRVATTRGPVARHRAALKAVRTKGQRGLRQAARKAPRTRKKAA